MGRLWAGVLAVACGGGPPVVVAPSIEQDTVVDSNVDDSDGLRDTGLVAAGDGSLSSPAGLLSPRAWVTRASLDLRGVRPSAAELSAATDDAAAAELVDGFVDDPRFGIRMAWVYNDVLHTGVWFDNSLFRVFPEMTPEQGRAAGFAPLALVEDIASRDRPWTDLVTATELPHNDVVASFFGVPGTGSGDAWVLAPAWDDRPMAGLLSSSTLWLAYDGDRTNFNRRRANAVSRVFLCADFLARDVSFDFRLSPDALADLERAVQTEPACGTCHAVLDPLASFFGGFVERSANEPTPQLARYSEWTAAWYRGWLSPAYHGRPGVDLTDLGAYLTDDPRFTRCATQQFSRGLLGGQDADPRLLEGFHADFEAGGLTLRALVRSIVHSEFYRSDALRVLTTEQLATSVSDLVGWSAASEEDLTELIWESEYRLLGGGTDDAAILARNPSTNVGHVVLQSWLARRVVAVSLDAEQARGPDDRRLFTVVDPGETGVSESQVREQLAVLHTRMVSVPVEAGGAEVDALLALFEAGGGAANPVAGWSVVLHALLRHPRAVLF